MPRLPARFSRPWLRLPLAGLLFVGAVVSVPRWWCGRDGADWLDGNPALVIPHAREVAAIVKEGVSDADFTSSSELFRNEWLFGSYQMAALGLLQTCAEHPEHLAPNCCPSRNGPSMNSSPNEFALSMHGPGKRIPWNRWNRATTGTPPISAT